MNAALFTRGATLPIRPALACGRRLGGLPGGRPYRRVPPVVGGPRVPWVESGRIRHETQLVEVPDCDVVEIDGAMVLYGLVFTADGTVVRESLIHRQHETTFLGLERAGDSLVVRDPGWHRDPMRPGRHVLMMQLYDGNYGHWLLDCLPKMAALRETLDLSGLPFVLTAQPDAMLAVFRDTLALYGVEPACLSFSGASVMPFERLVYATPLTQGAMMKAPLAVRALENLASRVGGDATAPRRIFVNRPAGARRRLINAEAVRAVFRRHDYTELCPAEMSFVQQVRGFSRANRVAGVLGADCTNLVFAPSGVRFLGLAPETMHDDFYWDLVSHKNGAYACLHGPAVAHELQHASDFSVDVTQLAEMLVALDAGCPG